MQRQKPRLNKRAALAIGLSVDTPPRIAKVREFAVDTLPRIAKVRKLL